MISPRELADVAWHISTKSANANGQCVEVGPLRDASERVAMRHSRRRGDEVIVYTREEWAAFVGGVKSGEFDFFAE